MTHGTIGALIISDMIIGKPNPWSWFYDPSRLPTSSMTEYIKENAKVGFQLKDYVTGSDVADIEDIPLGCGAVMRQGLSKVAVYRDEEGRFHTRSAVCPHLKCIVHWNSYESSWDCPCHGSRFTCYGEVVHGPANRDLEPAPTPQSKKAAKL